MLNHYACVLIHYIIAKDIWIELVFALFPSQTQYCVYVNGICVFDTSTIQSEHVSATHKALVAYTHVLSFVSYTHLHFWS
jgi:hypothetical protein